MFNFYSVRKCIKITKNNTDYMSLSVKILNNLYFIIK